MHKLCIIAACIMAGLSVPAAGQVLRQAQDEARADVCMAVGLDASGSINGEEMRLQLDGLAAALMDRRFARAIRAGPRKMIAIAVFTWADSREGVEILVPWVGMRDAKDALAVAGLLERRFVAHAVRSTSVLVALKAGTALLAECPWFADRQLLNIAGDGYTNIGPGPARARNSAVAIGITINGLVVGGDPAAVEHYRREVVGPPGIGFLVEVGDYADFAQAMINKLLLELAWTEVRDQRSGIGGALRRAQGEAR